MTGFGHSEGTAAGLDLSVDVKTVNGRYLDVVVRTPRELAAVEILLKKRVQEVLQRGRVEVWVNLKAQGNQQYELNSGLLSNYLEMARKAVAMGSTGSLDVSTLLMLPGVVAPRNMEFDNEEIGRGLLTVLDEALEAVLQERIHEGAALKEDLQARIAKLQALLEEIEPYRVDLAEHYRLKLTQRLEQLKLDQPVEPDRLAQEVLFYAEKADFSEEMTRLKRHLERFLEQIADSGQQSLGKGLDFLCQELNREANTILSKCQHVDISQLALQAKTEVEKIREQVQNVE